MTATSFRTTSGRRRLPGVRILLALGATVTMMMAAAPAAVADDQDLATVQVTVQSPTGQRAPGVVVSADGYAVGSTDGNGVVTAVVDAGVTSVCARLRPDSTSGGPTGWGEACAAVTLVTATTTAVHLRMPLAAAFGGTLRDARTGGPVAGATLVQVVSGEDMPATVTDGQGRYQFRGLDSGRYDLETLAIGTPRANPAAAPWGYAGKYPGGEGIVALTAGVVTTGVDLTVVPNVRVRGTVTDSGGRAVAGAPVIVRLDAGTVARTTTNSRGGYLFVVAWDSTGPVCASVAPRADYPTGLTRQCRSGLFENGIEVRADFTLTAGS